MKVAIVVAIDKLTTGIGYNGQLCWHDSADMKWFKSITTGDGKNAVIMGKTTYESIGKPLPNRVNIVLTHNREDIKDETVFTFTDIKDAIKWAFTYKCENVFIIGGASIYKQALDIKPNTPGYEYCEVDTVYVTEIENDSTTKFDTYFTYYRLDDDFYVDKFMSDYYTRAYRFNKSGDIKVYRRRYSNENTVDSQYFNLIKDILTNGQLKNTRAGNTLSVFGRMMRFNALNTLPILTSKKMYSRGCIHELLWFLTGNTNIKYLVENNTHIWDDDAYRYFLHTIVPNMTEYDNINYSDTDKDHFLSYVLKEYTVLYTDPNTGNIETYKFGDLGPVYGKQWINWNGVNQVDNLINTLKKNPDDRRLMISAWNVDEIKDMALPPCHYGSQWYTTKLTREERWKLTDGKYEYTDEELDFMSIPKYYLSVMWSQRSVDMCLGFPYDLLSYSVFLYLVASQCNMIPYEVICTLGDAHIYCNQIPDVYTQLDRNVDKVIGANLELNKKNSIYDYTIDDIHIKNYRSYPTVKYKLSVGL